MADEMDKDEFVKELRSQVGKTGSLMVARDPVNQSTMVEIHSRMTSGGFHSP